MTKKTLAILAFTILLVIPYTVFAGGSSNSCATKYPVVLAHGMGASAEILGIVDYWWGIDDALNDEGCRVYKTSVNGMDSTRNKAIAFRDQFAYIKAITGASKLNIIGHSHGTIYTRDAISNLYIGDEPVSKFVATHTSIAGPHQGSVIADLIIGIVPDSLEWLVGDTLDFVYAFVFGDTDPNSLENGYNLTRPYMQNVFNPNTQNVPGIMYQSWAAKAKTSCPSVILEATWLVMLIYEGANDGLVSVNSAKWGTFRGVEDAAWYSPGCDHLNIVDQLFGITPGFDAPDFFVDIVSELKNNGY
jgi:triacylglycerol lipase